MNRSHLTFGALVLIALSPFAHAQVPGVYRPGDEFRIASPCPGGQAQYALTEISGPDYSRPRSSDYRQSFAEYGPVYVLACEGDSDLYVVSGGFGEMHINVEYSNSGSDLVQLSPVGSWRVIAVTRPDSPLMMFFGEASDSYYRGRPIHANEGRTVVHSENPATLPRPTPYRHFIFVERLASEGPCTGQFELGYASTSWGSPEELPFAYEGLTFTGLCMGTPDPVYAVYMGARHNRVGGVRPLRVMDSRWKDDNTLQAYVNRPGTLDHLIFETDVRTGASRVLAALQWQRFDANDTSDYPRGGIMIGDVNVASECFDPRFEGARLVAGKDVAVLFYENRGSVLVDFSNPAALSARIIYDHHTCDGFSGTLEARNPSNNPERFGLAFTFEPHSMTYSGRHGERVEYAF